EQGCAHDRAAWHDSRRRTGGDRCELRIYARPSIIGCQRKKWPVVCRPAIVAREGGGRSTEDCTLPHAGRARFCWIAATRGLLRRCWDGAVGVVERRWEAAKRFRKFACHACVTCRNVRKSRERFKKNLKEISKRNAKRTPPQRQTSDT